MTTTLAFYIDDDVTWVDGIKPVDTPMEALESLDLLLARLSGKFSDRLDGGTVILSEDTITRLGFPKKPPRGKNAETHPVLDSARNVGWSVSGLGPWMTFHRRRFDCPSVHIGVLPWLTERTFSFIDEPSRDGMVMTENIRMFSHLMGSAFRMRPGVTANAALMSMWGGHKPFWKPSWDGVVPAEYAREMRYQWSSLAPMVDNFEHGWDIRQQYLAAANVSEVGLNQLRHTGRKKFDKSPGYWLITMPDWNHKVCPHPGGNFQGGEQVWVATPTVAYLHEMAEKLGVIAEPTIHDSWTTTRSHRMFRYWSERIRDGYNFAMERGNRCVATALKDGYKQAIGQWQTPTGFIQRPDWADIVAANARVNLHRKIWKEGQREGGQWPSRIVYDCVYYPGPDDMYDVPPTFYEGQDRLPLTMGKFKFEKTLRFGEVIKNNDDDEWGRE